MEQSYAEFLEERGATARGHRYLRDALRMVLKERFGPTPQEAETAIAAATPDRLTDWLRIAATATDLQAVGIS